MIFVVLVWYFIDFCPAPDILDSPLEDITYEHPVAEKGTSKRKDVLTK